MCRELAELAESVRDFSAGFDASALMPSHAGWVVRVCAQMEASIASVKALSAARSAEGSAWQQEGFRTPADHLAQMTGVSGSNARRTLETGRRLAQQPDVAQAALAGELSPDQAAAVSDGVAANPAKARELIDKAKGSSLGELNDEVARTKAAVADLEARRRQIHSKRCLRRWTDRDGAFQAHLYGQPQDGVGLWRMLDPIRRRLVVLRREAGERERLDALDYDALMTLAALAAGEHAEIDLPELLGLGLFPQLDAAALPSPPTAPAVAKDLSPCGTANPANPADPADPADPPGRPDPDSRRPDPDSRRPDPDSRRRRTKLAFGPAKVMIRVDLDTLLRKVPVDGELCEIVGYGPVPVSVIEELIANGNAFLAAVLTRGRELVGVYHHGRRPNAYQETALDFLHPMCAVKGCASRAGLQSDHRTDWVKTHYTVLDLLDRLCPHHHRLKTHRNWALVEGSGKRDFVPPDDPRYPRRRRTRDTG